ncbi:hypothetical protein QFZ94_007363 [Paraburkholderia sp. JPY465]
MCSQANTSQNAHKSLSVPPYVRTRALLQRSARQLQDVAGKRTQRPARKRLRRDVLRRSIGTSRTPSKPRRSARFQPKLVLCPRCVSTLRCLAPHPGRLFRILDYDVTQRFGISPSRLYNCLRCVLFRCERTLGACIYSYIVRSTRCRSRGNRYLRGLYSGPMYNLFETNVFGAMLAMQVVIPCFRAIGGGRVINISSDSPP